MRFYLVSGISKQDGLPIRPATPSIINGADPVGGSLDQQQPQIPRISDTLCTKSKLQSSAVLRCSAWLWIAASLLTADGQDVPPTAPPTDCTASAATGEGVSGMPAGGGIGGPASVPSQLRGEQATGPTYRFPGFDQLLQPRFHIKNRLIEDLSAHQTGNSAANRVYLCSAGGSYPNTGPGSREAKCEVS
jgi:hypothetical protein